MTSQRDRHDFGALEQRVYGAERKIDDLSAQTSQQIQSLRTELGGAIQAISTKIDQQQVAQIDISRTRWTPIISTVAALVGAFVAIFGVVGSMALGPIRSDIDKLYAVSDKTNERMTPLLTLSDDQKSNVVRFAALEKSEDGKWSKDAQAEYEKRIDEVNALQRDYAKRDLERVENHIDTVDNNQIKRPEITALFANQTALVDNQSDRTDSLSRNLEDARHEIGSAYNVGDEIKALRAQIENLSSRMFGLLSPPSSTAPTAPVSPSK
jgi:hypothetical protein